MKRALIIGLSLWVRVAIADAPRVLVLPLPHSASVDAELARAFDARFLVALEGTHQVTTVTLADELECATPKCLADAGTAANTRSVLTTSIVREAKGLTVFASLLDSSTAAPIKRAELAHLTNATLSTTAPVELARKLVGPAPGPAVIGFERPRSPAGQAAASALVTRLAALQTFTIAPGDKVATTLTHRAELSIAELSITPRRHHVHHYLDGTLVATFAIVDLADDHVVLTKTVHVATSRRVRQSTNAEITALLVEQAVEEWMTAFVAVHAETQLSGGTTR